MGKDLLEGRTAVVTGATRGIGYAIAAALSGSGATVVISGRSEAGVSEAVRRLTNGGKGKVIGKAADVRTNAEVEELFTWIDRETGGPTFW
jgi:NAD(P)-dependent dehydrogenase (short-subunit alcohol dehydrogenase family)